jgi:hypothetical protein
VGKYGQAALDAVSLLISGKAIDPVDAWEQATIAIFGKGAPSQTKSCPHDAFVGLCDAGLMKSVSPGAHTHSVDNKAYAVTAAQLLLANPGLSQGGVAALWIRVMKRLKKSSTKTHNQQMDVVKTLFDHGLI